MWRPSWCFARRAKHLRDSGFPWLPQTLSEPGEFGFGKIEFLKSAQSLSCVQALAAKYFSCGKSEVVVL
jgi:hypothetical protein